ncbi:UNVERIFIED_CONTAM: hypothetical protein Cloal_3564 [Acetivibrio alkalicellulosi]
MAFKVKVDGVNLEKSIEAVYFKVDTPNDSDARFSHVSNTVEIVGTINTDEPTVEMYLWSLLPSDNDKAYRNVEIEVIFEKETIRKVTFSKAFVVDYSESYSVEKGDGIFTIFLKQKKDLNSDVIVSGF